MVVCACARLFSYFGKYGGLNYNVYVLFQPPENEHTSSAKSFMFPNQQKNILNSIWLSLFIFQGMTVHNRVFLALKSAIKTVITS